MKIDKTLMSGSTPLLVLSLLTDGEKYGYEMIIELERRSDSTFSLKEGTLYPLLHTMEKDGLVKAESRTAPSGRERKYYSLTKKGQTFLKEKRQEWELFSEKVNTVLSFSV